MFISPSLSYTSILRRAKIAELLSLSLLPPRPRPLADFDLKAGPGLRPIGGGLGAGRPMTAGRAVISGRRGVDQRGWLSRTSLCERLCLCVCVRERAGLLGDTTAGRLHHPTASKGDVRAHWENERERERRGPGQRADDRFRARPVYPPPPLHTLPTALSLSHPHPRQINKMLFRENETRACVWRRRRRTEGGEKEREETS